MTPIRLLCKRAAVAKARGLGRQFLHWLQALVALPAVAYAVRPFARSALAALRARGSNMDVPITLGVLLATGMDRIEEKYLMLPNMLRQKKYIRAVHSAVP